MASFWNGYTLQDFLFNGFNIGTPQGFAGVFVSLVSISICYEGIRTIRDFVYLRFLNSKKKTLLQESNRGSPDSTVRYAKSGHSRDTGDIAEKESLTCKNYGGGDASSTLNHNSDEDIHVEDDDEPESLSKCNKHLVTTPDLSRDTSSTPLAPVDPAQRRRRELMDLSLSSLLHMIYVGLGYTLMLAVMTWNVLVLVAVVLGIGIGFAFFGTLRHSHDHPFKYFGINDSCEERLLNSQDQSKTESSSTGSGASSTHEQTTHCAGADLQGQTSNELVIGVQVHATQAPNEISSAVSA